MSCIDDLMNNSRDLALNVIVVCALMKTTLFYEFFAFSPLFLLRLQLYWS